MTKYINKLEDLPTNKLIPSDVLTNIPWVKEIDSSNNEVLALAGVYLVPEPQNTQTANTILVANKNEQGELYSTWIDVDEYNTILENRRLAKSIRMERNNMLAATDWTQGKDISNTVSSAWTSYRQGLRDITSQPGFPLTIVWPKPPQ